MTFPALVTLGALAKEAAAGGHCSSGVARDQGGWAGEGAGSRLGLGAYCSQGSRSPLTILMVEFSPSHWIRSWALNPHS